MITLPNVVDLPPYEFSGAYKNCYDLPLSCMDKRHVYLLHDILCSWPFKSALEIGSFHGASATAFVEAVNKGQGLGESGIATLCEVSVQDQLFEVVRNCKSERVRVTPQPSWLVLDSDLPFDFIFVDGAHDLDTVTLEVTKLLRRKPLCVMAHDTNASNIGWGKCEGAKYLADTFKGLTEYRCIEDIKKREGEATDRGLFFATTDPDLFEVASRIFRKHT